MNTIDTMKEGIEMLVSEEGDIVHDKLNLQLETLEGDDYEAAMSPYDHLAKILEKEDDQLRVLEIFIDDLVTIHDNLEYHIKKLNEIYGQIA